MCYTSFMLAIFITHLCTYVYAHIIFSIESMDEHLPGHHESPLGVTSAEYNSHASRQQKLWLVLIAVVVTGKSTRLRSLKTQVLTLTLPLTSHLPLAKSLSLCPHLSSLRCKDRCIAWYERCSPVQLSTVMIYDCVRKG